MNTPFETIIIIGCLAMGITAQEPFVVDSCDDGNALSAEGGWWYTYNDNNTGGNSYVTPPVNGFKMGSPGYGDRGFAAHMKGTAGDKLGWDYIGIGVNLTDKCGCPEAVPVDISQYSKVRFRMKGTLSGGRLTMLLPYTENRCDKGANSPATLTEWADYEAPLTAILKPDWILVELDLRKAFHQPRWAKSSTVISIEVVLRNLKNINFHFSSPDGDSIDLWLDDIEFIR